MWGKAHVKPIEYLRAVYNALSRALGADFSFGGNLIKNPTHSKHDTFLTGAKSSYSLDELAQFLDLTTKPDPLRKMMIILAGIAPCFTKSAL